MSEDLVNQLTLNFLISKNQLQKLNKKNKDDAKTKWNTEYLAQRDRLKILFEQLLFNNEPDDLLIDVRDAFDDFVNKSVYYFKAHDTTENLEKERNNDIIHDDIDYEKEEREIENGNYTEKTYNDDEENNEDEDDKSVSEEDNDYEECEEGEEGEVKQTNTNVKTNHEPIVVAKKYRKKISNGVEDIQKLPLDWFENVRQNYKKNQIIPRKKETPDISSSSLDIKKKI